MNRNRQTQPHHVDGTVWYTCYCANHGSIGAGLSNGTAVIWGAEGVLAPDPEPPCNPYELVTRYIVPPTPNTEVYVGTAREAADYVYEQHPCTTGAN